MKHEFAEHFTAANGRFGSCSCGWPKWTDTAIWPAADSERRWLLHANGAVLVKDNDPIVPFVEKTA